MPGLTFMVELIRSIFSRQDSSVGGGGTKSSCLNAWLGSRLAQLGELNEAVLLLIILLIVSAVTQVASNTATASMLLPILMELSRVLEVIDSIME